MSVTQLHPATLGGSTIGAAVGVNPYVSPIRQWLRMTGREQVEENEAMRWGRALQAVIFDGLRADGLDVYAADPDRALTDPERRWLSGHPDGYTGAVPYGVVEAKAAGYGHHEPPAHWQAQVQTYMHLAGLDQALIAQLAGLKLTVWEIERDEHAIDLMLDLAAEFVGYVERDEQPPPQGHPDDRDSILALHPEAERGKVRRETKEIRDARKELAALMEAEKARAARIAYLRSVVVDHLADADTLISAHDEVVATWKLTPTTHLDTARLKAQLPEVYEAYVNRGTTRRFVLT